MPILAPARRGSRYLKIGRNAMLRYAESFPAVRDPPCTVIGVQRASLKHVINHLSIVANSLRIIASSAVRKLLQGGCYSVPIDREMLV